MIDRDAKPETLKEKYDCKYICGKSKELKECIARASTCVNLDRLEGNGYSGSRCNRCDVLSRTHTVLAVEWYEIELHNAHPTTLNTRTTHHNLAIPGPERLCFHSCNRVRLDTGHTFQVPADA